MNCPACGSPDAGLAEEVSGYRLLRCAACSLTYSDPMRAGDEAFYSDHIVYATVGDATAQTQFVSADNAANRALLARLPKGGRAIDLGCGYGAFTALAVRHGLDAYGVDFNAAEIATGARVFGLDGRLHAGRVEELPSLAAPASYDLVSMFEVIEHVENPRALLAQAFGLLKPGGLLALSCPNEARWMGGGRIFVDYPPHHLTRWTPRALQHCLTGIGFASIESHIDASLRDIVWTMVVNRSARRAGQQATAGGNGTGVPGARNWKHRLFDVAGVLSTPVDIALKAAGIGTMGMRTYARRP